MSMLWVQQKMCTIEPLKYNINVDRHRRDACATKLTCADKQTMFK